MRLSSVALLMLLCSRATADEAPIATPPDAPPLLQRPSETGAHEAGAAAEHAAARPVQRSRSAAVRPAGGAGDPGGSWLRSFGSLLGVVALIVLLSWGYRVVALGRGVRLTSGGRRAPLIEIVSRYTLSRKQTLCLVRVGPRLVLLAVGEQVRTLDVISDPDLASTLLGQVALEPNERAGAFQAALAREDKAYGAQEDNESDAHEIGADTSLNQARSALLGSLRRLRAPAGAGA
ncbi:Flagellar biosynthesis protein, FliO [Phycisphaerae bacterium RAS1]|nr:Flagellar biosynthesis protein, FliO [Phycisphaerae bacterium RAS1]